MPVFLHFFKLLSIATHRAQEAKRAQENANLVYHTFHQFIYKCSQIVGLFLFSFTHLNNICKVLTNILKQLSSHFHLSLKESEQRILDGQNNESKLQIKVQNSCCKTATKSNPKILDGPTSGTMTTTITHEYAVCDCTVFYNQQSPLPWRSN